MSGPSDPGRRGAGRRALFSDPDAGPAAGRRVEEATADDIPQGRRALYSSATGDRPEPGRASAVVHCRTCLAATRVSLLSLGLSLVPSLWLPTRTWPRLMRCPACRRVSWCRIEWPNLR